MPRGRNTYPRTNVIADPLHSAAILFARENIEAHLHPVIDALRDLQRLVLLVICRIDTLNLVTLAECGEVRMQFHHCAARWNGLGPIDLNFVIALRFER